MSKYIAFLCGKCGKVSGREVSRYSFKKVSCKNCFSTTITKKAKILRVFNFPYELKNFINEKNIMNNQMIPMEEKEIILAFGRGFMAKEAQKKR